MKPLPTLLSRDVFRESVFGRDRHLCVFCKRAAQDAHHIMERRLFGETGGYYLDNGASVCGEHHLECESTKLSVESARAACGITQVVLPPHLYRDQAYDKWGNPILPTGQRLRGELFFDESVQRALALNPGIEFTHWVKYPRTHHLPWSEGITDDDRVMASLEQFQGRRVVVTTKMDGENTTLYTDHMHARSVDSKGHESRNWVKSLWGQICGDIPPGWRLCGENLYAKHSIAYQELPSYFMEFSLWNDRNKCLSWDDTIEWFSLLNLQPVPVLYDGIFDEKLIKLLWTAKQWNQVEGYVVRVADSFEYREFPKCVGKFVRPKHVQTSAHWMHGQAVIKNLLAT